MLVEIEIEKFPLGRLVLTHDASEALHPDDVRAAIRRHAMGDWGECSVEDCQKNEAALREGLPLRSVYSDRQGREFWVNTEYDRLEAMVSFPEDI